MFLKASNNFDKGDAKSLLQLIQDYLLDLLNDRKFTLSTPFSIDKFVSEAAFIYRRAVVSLSGIHKDTGVKDLQKVFCFLWTYLTTALDIALYKQQQTID